MKAAQGMQRAAEYMEIDKGMREGVARGATFWTALAVVLVVFSALIFFLRIAVKRAADQKTRRIILENMDDDQSGTEDASDPPDKSPDSGPDAR